MIQQDTLRETLATAYAAGALEPSLRLLVETQAALDATAAWDLACAEEVAALQFEAETAVALKSGALDAVLARLTEDPFQERAEKAPCRRAAEAAGTVITEVLALPIQVRELALEAIGQGSWVFGGPGLRSLPLPVQGPAKTELLRIEPGWGAPRHSHKGGEYTLVITGAFTDERGTYRVGDVAVAGPDVTHRPVAQKGAVCYALAVTEAPLAMTGALGFLQRVWRH